MIYLIIRQSILTQSKRFDAEVIQKADEATIYKTMAGEMEANLSSDWQFLIVNFLRDDTQCFLER